MKFADYGLIELPSEERYGFVWAVLTADAGIDVDAHLGELAPHLAELDYPSFGYHDHRELESDVSWKGALEAFAEGYHFPFVHGKSLIGMNTLPNTAIYDEYGRHHRIGFPFNWITNLADDPCGSWDVRDNMGVIYWIYPNLILANSSVGVEITRGQRTIEFPARAMVVAATNPCPCGRSAERCTCDALALARYARRMSGPARHSDW